MNRLHIFALVTTGLTATMGALVACTTDEVITGQDAGVLDASTDRATSTEASADDDSGVTPFDAGADANEVQKLSFEIAEHICNAYTRCCYGDPTVAQDEGVDGGDAGTGRYDRAACIKEYASIGFEGSSYGVSSTQKAITINAAKRTECLAKLDALSCTQTATEIKAVRASCYDVLEGQVAAGNPCRATIQCARGAFCNTGLDAGPDGGDAVGVCSPIRGANQPCGDVQVSSSIARDSVDSEVACSWRGSGDTGNACKSFDSVTGSYKTDRTAWTCQPTVANGEVCNTNVTCANGLCDPGPTQEKYRCEPELTYFPPQGCQFYLRP